MSAPRKPASSYKLLAFDPGERTGYVLVRVGARFNPRTSGPAGFKIVNQGVLTVRDIGKHLRSLITRADRVAYETWRLYPDYAHAMIGNDMQPSQVVGMIRYEAWQQRKPLHSNGAGIKKAAVASMPKWLKTHMALSSEQHDQDAIMHAWHVARERYYQRTETLK